MKQQLKYGLVTPLREFELPSATEEETISITGAEKIASHTYFVANTTTQVDISREVEGDQSGSIEIRVEKDTQVKIIEVITGSGSLQANTTIIIEPGAYVEYSILQDLSEDSVVVLNYTARTRESGIHWFFCGLGADTTKAVIKTVAGDDSVVKNHAVICGTGKQQFDIHVATEHHGGHSTSDMLTRSVLDGNARATYHGMIHIGPDSPQCDSYQKDEVILLSDGASADAIPNLEIQNNTVRCTHGASIGKLDEEKLFYLLSRGIEREDAKRMITEGFLEPLFTAPWQPRIREKISHSSKAE